MFDNDFIENTYDVSYSYLLSLIKENNYFSVKEVWKIICLTLANNATNMNLLRIDDIQENNFQNSKDKKLQFNKSMSLAKKAITLQGDGKNDNELDTLLKNYIERKTLQCEKETKEREMRALKENYNSRNVLTVETDNEQRIYIDDIANPLRHVGKGAPKKTWLKGAQEDYQPTKKG
ncbi:14516_t:CDS:2 [Dentiscutata erythropus]|uniref:14516_t:CDS:1 n=1 Tax=Dentiscutata erythropus TaxID=1348616 RepID=A0A9N9IK79_9GLOM|nr:14516_t:CDS:2 [Dentiscutata erythropus]